MRYPAQVTMEGDVSVAIFRFSDGSECATQADPGESIEAMALECLVGRLGVYLMDGESPPRPPKRAPKGALWVDVPPELATVLALRRAREDAGISQAELARRMGVAQQQIAKLEGLKSNPTVGTLARVARALGTQLEVRIA